ncbi:DMT family transporter [Roseovarius dicentrarchi]|uniref:DMT family transporter n=1 Tax=Roseovarius dicentrarchi TaxID=2250573 RepID=UPI000DEAC4AD|nr:DMT family transporter [Roseovarius dicentrarchi]
MRRHPAFGLGLAAFGALALTPDAMLLRLSGMDGPQMMGWRGLFMGTALLLIWAAVSRRRRADLALLGSGAGIAIVACQFFNSSLFSLGIAGAPVAIVLFGVATTPIFAALFARALLGERTARATWITIAAVAAGIGIAVLGGGGVVAPTGAVIFGALAGLGVAAMLALNFVVLRAHPQLPIPLLIGIGALCAGAAGITATGPAQMLDGKVWAIALTGCVVLPVSFMSLSFASRYTAASNVSLLLLLETVLGPVWVWLALGEDLTPAMLLGGGIVVGSIALYLLHARRFAYKARVRPGAAN